jgi:hypothetical protein
MSAPHFPHTNFTSPKISVVFFLRREGTIVVLLVVGGHQDILSNFNKMLHVAALRTGDAPGRFTSGNIRLSS